MNQPGIVQPVHGAKARRLMIGFNPARREIIVAMATNLGQVNFAMTTAQARDVARQIEDICERFDPRDGNKVILA